MYSIVYTKNTATDITSLKSAKQDSTIKALIEILREDPYRTPPTCEKLQGDLHGAFSRRINFNHWLVYQVYEEERTVKIISMWTHYEI